MAVKELNKRLQRVQNSIDRICRNSSGAIRLEIERIRLVSANNQGIVGHVGLGNDQLREIVLIAQAEWLKLVKFVAGDQFPRH